MGAVRPSWDVYFLNVAGCVAMRSSCTRLAVGCVLVDTDHRIVGTGYNGAPAGARHCNHSDGGDMEHGHCALSLHAEANALLYCTGRPEVAYVTHRPCWRCALLLKGAGVTRTVWKEEY